MYVACVPLKVAGRRVQPGEEVPEADKWRETVRRAHENLGWIKLADGHPPNHGAPVAQAAAAPAVTDGPAAAADSSSSKGSSRKRNRNRKGGAVSGPTAETQKNPPRTTSAS